MATAAAYRTLGLAPGASNDEVRLAYKRLALQYHPDKNRDGIDTTEVFQRISAAYKHISDPPQDQHDGEMGSDFHDAAAFEDFMQMFDAMFRTPSLFGSKKKAKGKRRGMRRRGAGRSKIDLDEFLFAGLSAFGDMNHECFAHMPGMTFSMPGDPFGDEDDLAALFEEMARLQTKPGKSKLRPTGRNRRRGAQTPAPKENKESYESVTTDDAESSPIRHSVQIGDSVAVSGGKLKGTVAFVGNVHYCKGEMVGVVFDEAVGKNSGTIKGVEYFKCLPQHGLMVQLQDVART
ncbi:hypothetical protein H310_01739 [Aphanomyces invadans]|uniref:J domain-containing protein n=1 Tax=Aphanomyces invadans TaxID=157072 RepID=A0A024USR5_9STRA|nr:hypothetical protein H310_01739 [Aphanomyces invadans]ETW09384.1 hypothetical protein H310_01739 [Aphanomyces invadans]|eukprot:XP_008863189.1 hypothetical protein H310_01739 [Aphanomyces invadans]